MKRVSKGLFISLLFLLGCKSEMTQIDLQRISVEEIITMFNAEQLEQIQQALVKFDDKEYVTVGDRNVLLNISDTLIPFARDYQILSNLNCYDNKQDVFELRSQPGKYKNTKGVFLVSSRSQLDSTTLKDHYILRTTPFRTFYAEPVCSSGIFKDKYYNNPIARSRRGTAFAIGEHHILTAGHLVTHVSDSLCKQSTTTVNDFAFILGFETNADGSIQKAFSKDQVYFTNTCVYCKNQGAIDIALFETKRKIDTCLLPRIDLQSEIGKCDEVYLIGHPLGLTKKIADHGKVTTIFNEYFEADVDALETNSGSPVYNSKTHMLEGLMPRGSDRNYIENCTSCPKSCVYTRVCRNSGDCPFIPPSTNPPSVNLCEKLPAEPDCSIPDVIKISVILDELKKSGISLNLSTSSCSDEIKPTSSMN